MIVGASIGSFMGLDLDQSIRLYGDIAKELNLRGIELRSEKERGVPYLDLGGKYNKNKIIDLMSQYYLKGMHLSFAYFNFICPNDTIKNVSICNIKREIIQSAELGLDYVVMHAKGFDYDSNFECQLDYWVQTVNEIVECAETHSILLTIENADSLKNLSELVRVVREVDSPYCRITLDVGHAYNRIANPHGNYSIEALFLKLIDRIPVPFISSKYMPYAEYGSLDNFLKKEKDLIHHIHMHDNNGIFDHLPIGDGKINFSFLKPIKDFDIPIIFEIHYDMDYDRIKIDYLKIMGDYK